MVGNIRQLEQWEGACGCDSQGQLQGQEAIAPCYRRGCRNRDLLILLASDWPGLGNAIPVPAQGPGERFHLIPHDTG